MDSLNDDVLIEMFSYLTEEEIFKFQDCFPKIMSSLAPHSKMHVIHMILKKMNQQMAEYLKNTNE